MADTIIGEAASAVAAEGGMVALLPNPEAEQAEERDEASPPVSEPEPVPAPTVVVVEAPPEPVPQPDWAGQVQAHEERLQRVEQRLTLSELRAVEMRGMIDARALSAHDHPVDPDVRIIAEELRALASEEVAPRRGGLLGMERGWLRRKLRGEG